MISVFVVEFGIELESDVSNLKNFELLLMNAVMNITDELINQNFLRFQRIQKGSLKQIQETVEPLTFKPLHNCQKPPPLSFTDFKSTHQTSSQLSPARLPPTKCFKLYKNLSLN